VGLAPPRPVAEEESVGQAPPYKSPEEVGRGRPTLDQVEGRLYPEPPGGGNPNGADAQEPACETNPIYAGACGGQVSCGTKVRNDPVQGKSGETNPICDQRSLRKWEPRNAVHPTRMTCAVVSSKALYGKELSVTKKGWPAGRAERIACPLFPFYKVSSRRHGFRPESPCTGMNVRSYYEYIFIITVP
jgi:hypothetical protein